MEINICNELGDRIYRIRKEKDISQDYLAQKVGVTRQTISKWEANFSKPKADKLQLICDALGVELDVLMPNKETMIANVEDHSVDVNVDEISVEVVCDEIAAQENVTEQAGKKKRKLSTKAKIAIIATLLAIVLIVGIVLILVGTVTQGGYEGSFNDTVTTDLFKFSLDDFGWGLLIVSISATVLLGIILICRYALLNKKNKNK